MTATNVAKTTICGTYWRGRDFYPCIRHYGCSLHFTFDFFPSWLAQRTLTDAFDAGVCYRSCWRESVKWHGVHMWVRCYSLRVWKKNCISKGREDWGIRSLRTLVVVVCSFGSGPFRPECGDWTVVFLVQSDCNGIILCLLLSLFMFLLRFVSFVHTNVAPTQFPLPPFAHACVVRHLDCSVVIVLVPIPPFFSPRVRCSHHDYHLSLKLRNKAFLGSKAYYYIYKYVYLHNWGSGQDRANQQQQEGHTRSELTKEYNFAWCH